MQRSASQFTTRSVVPPGASAAKAGTVPLNGYGYGTAGVTAKGSSLGSDADSGGRL